MKNKVRKLKLQRLKIEANKYKDIKTKAVHDQEYEMAAYYRGKEKDILDEISGMDEENY